MANDHIGAWIVKWSPIAASQKTLLGVARDFWIGQHKEDVINEVEKILSLREHHIVGTREQLLSVRTASWCEIRFKLSTSKNFCTIMNFTASGTGHAKKLMAGDTIHNNSLGGSITFTCIRHWGAVTFLSHNHCFLLAKLTIQNNKDWGLIGHKPRPREQCTQTAGEGSALRHVDCDDD